MPASIVSVALTLGADLATFSETDQRSLRAALVISLRCHPPSCSLDLHFSGGSLLVHVSLTSVGAAADQLASIAAAEQLTAEPPASLSTVLGVDVISASVTRITTASIPLAVAPPPPSPPPPRNPPLPPPSPPSLHVAVILPLVFGGVALVGGMLLLVSCCLRWRRALDQIEQRGKRRSRGHTGRGLVSPAGNGAGNGADNRSGNDMIQQGNGKSRVGVELKSRLPLPIISSRHAAGGLQSALAGGRASSKRTSGAPTLSAPRTASPGSLSNASDGAAGPQSTVPSYSTPQKLIGPMTPRIQYSSAGVRTACTPRKELNATGAVARPRARNHWPPEPHGGTDSRIRLPCVSTARLVSSPRVALSDELSASPLHSPLASEAMSVASTCSPFSDALSVSPNRSPLPSPTSVRHSDVRRSRHWQGHQPGGHAERQPHRHRYHGCGQRRRRESDGTRARSVPPDQRQRRLPQH